MGAVPIPPGDEPGGIEIFTYLLTKYLASHMRVSVLDLSVGAQQSRMRLASGATFYSIPRLPIPHSAVGKVKWQLMGRILRYILVMIHVVYFAFLSGLCLFKMLKSQRVDIIHTHSKEVAIAAFVFRRLARSRAIMVHNSHAAVLLEKLDWKKRFMNILEFVAISKADHVFVDSQSVKEILTLKFGYDGSRVSVLYGGGAYDDLQIVKARSSGLVRTPTKVLCVGSVNSRKNQLAAVRAIPAILQRVPGVHFVFAGPYIQDDYFNSIQCSIQSLGISKSVSFLGPVTASELESLYLTSGIFLFPSVAESQGTVIAEAAKFGLRIAASEIPPVREVSDLIPGSILTFNPYDPKSISENVVELLRLSKVSQTKGEFDLVMNIFGWENISRRAENLYGEILTLNGRPFRS